MSFFGGIKKVVGGIGDAVGRVAPALTLIPGVGPVAAGIAGAAGKVAGKLNDRGGLNLGNGLKAAAGGALYGGGGALAIDKAASLLGGGGFAGGIRRAVLGSPAPGAPGVPGATPPSASHGIGSVVDWFTDKDRGANRTQLLATALGGVGSAAGAAMAGHNEDQDAAFRRERAIAADKQRETMMNLFLTRLGGAQPAAGA